MISHLGDSGSWNERASWSSDGIAPDSAIHLHEWDRLNMIAPMLNASTCPPVMATVSKVTTRPRHAAGHSSLRKTGVTIDASPTPRPTMTRPRTSSLTICAAACSIAPRVKRTADRRITRFLPNRSDNHDAAIAPAKAPNVSPATTSSSCPIVNGRPPTSEPNVTSMTEMDAESRPKSRPDTLATMATRRTKGVSSVSSPVSSVASSSSSSASATGTTPTMASAPWRSRPSRAIAS